MPGYFLAFVECMLFALSVFELTPDSSLEKSHYGICGGRKVVV